MAAVTAGANGVSTTVRSLGALRTLGALSPPAALPRAAGVGDPAETGTPEVLERLPARRDRRAGDLRGLLGEAGRARDPEGDAEGVYLDHPARCREVGCGVHAHLPGGNAAEACRTVRARARRRGSRPSARHSLWRRRPSLDSRLARADRRRRCHVRGHRRRSHRGRRRHLRGTRHEGRLGSGTRWAQSRIRRASGC